MQHTDPEDPIVPIVRSVAILRLVQSCSYAVTSLCYSSSLANVALPALLSFGLPISPVIQRPISAILTMSIPVSHPRLCNKCSKSSVATLPVTPLLCSY